MSQSLYTTFGNEISYEIRRDKLVKFLENNTINFPLPEASLEILQFLYMILMEETRMKAYKY